MKIQGNIFLVTGGCGTIGFSIAKDLVNNGGNVVVFDVLPNDKAADVLSQLPSTNVSYQKVDITDSDQVKSSLDAGIKAFPNAKFVGAVHCAGVSVRRDYTNKVADSIPNFKKMLEVNTLGTFIIDSHVADAINAPYDNGTGDLLPRSEEERGIIINFASAAANPFARVLSYGPTKTAVIGITKSMADFLGPSGIRVCSISPSVVASGLTGGKILEYFMSELEATAVFPRRRAEASEMAHGARYIIENQMMNGVDLPIDGGWKLTTLWHKDLPDPRTQCPGLE